MIAPILQTDRLTLRPHTSDDFAPYAAFFASKRATTVGGPLSAKQAWFFFCNDIAQWSLHGFGAWGVERTEDGVFLGQVAIQHPPFFPERELGWVLLDGFEGHGYATEAAGAARDWAFANLDDARLVSYISPDNVTSISVAERLGAERDLIAEAPSEEDLVYRHKVAA